MSFNIKLYQYLQYMNKFLRLTPAPEYSMANSERVFSEDGDTGGKITRIKSPIVNESNQPINKGSEFMYGGNGYENANSTERFRFNLNNDVLSFHRWITQSDGSELYMHGSVEVFGDVISAWPPLTSITLNVDQLAEIRDVVNVALGRQIEFDTVPTNGTSLLQRLECDISGNAVTAAAAKEGSVLDTTLNGKLDKPSIIPSLGLKQIGESIFGTSEFEELGFSVSINQDGTIVAIGSRNARKDDIPVGSVKIMFKNETGGWSQKGNTIYGLRNSFLGQSVSLSKDGSKCAIGLPGYSSSLILEGMARVYEFNGTDWVQMGQDLGADGAATSLFGKAVSLSGDGSTVAVGAAGKDSNYDYVTVYKWTPPTTLTSGSTSGSWDQVEGDFANLHPVYNNSVSLNDDGSVIAIGMYQDLGNGSSLGMTKVFEHFGSSTSIWGLPTTNGLWAEIGNLNGETSDDNFGWSVSLSDNRPNGTMRLAVGAIYNDGTGNNSGHVRVYEYTSGTWTQLGEDIDGEATEDNSGWSVSLSADGNTLAIGAPLAKDGSGTATGHVRIYTYASGTWMQIVSDIDGKYNGENGNFGSSVSLSADGTTVAIGAYRESYDDLGNNIAHMGRFEVYNLYGGQILDITVNMATAALKVNDMTSSSKMGTVQIYEDLTIGDPAGPNPYTNNRLLAANLKVETNTCNFFVASGQSQYFYNGSDHPDNVKFRIGPYNSGVFAVNFSMTSDDRIKENEQLIQNATDTLLKLRPQIYDKTSLNAEDTASTKKEAGLIVQEIYYEVPELRFLLSIPEDATLIDDDKHANFNDIRNDPDYSNWGSKPGALSYTGLIPYLIQGFKEQHAAMEAQKATIAAQAQELSEQKALIQSLIARMDALEA